MMLLPGGPHRRGGRLPERAADAPTGAEGLPEPNRGDSGPEPARNGPVPSGDRGGTLGPASFRPGALDGIQTPPTGGQVEYLLARNSVIREFRKGRLSRLDVCDAHPELIRAATNLGRTMGEQCPICEESELVDVTFVFGSKLPAGGRGVAPQAELARFWRRKEPVVCYVVEVCCGCRWNHLARMYPAGAGVDAVARKPLRSRTKA